MTSVSETAAQAAPPGRLRRIRFDLRRAGQAALPWLLPGLLLLVWELLGRTGHLTAALLPAPSEVLTAGVTLIGTGELLTHLWVSFTRAISGLAVGGSLAFLLGLANGLSRLSERLTDTSIQMIRNIPALSLIPLVILWFGIEEGAKLFLVSLAVFFPIYVNTFHGIRTVDPQLVEMGKSYGMNRWDLFARVVLPGALPSIFVGLRYALGLMWLTLIVAETIAAQSGLGYLAMHAREFMLTDVVVLAILIYALLGKLADSIARLLERRTLRWHAAFRSE
ncbi:ABC transporter permease subunit [Elstera cyanobacteriorum]|uniref:ABC transporter permease subunit n=1 Tax=Elstera cyanobacteriorum TaxID=2022747 RepID=UPI0023552612|nr:ABC transporter permease subunit [Elstera cyanobacteriorum]MCK6443085.1 ABC transporter permease subunit [Elstera cyanobacteriorum]